MQSFARMLKNNRNSLTACSLSHYCYYTMLLVPAEKVKTYRFEGGKIIK